MWLFTRYGFFSVAVRGAGDKRVAEVRARKRSHLENLVKAKKLKTPILALRYRDYAYRIRLPLSQWTAIVGELASEQTWSNFKDQCRKSLAKDRAYQDLLHDVWFRGLQMQRGALSSEILPF